jgi:hypothetical protein
MAKFAMTVKDCRVKIPTVCAQIPSFLMENYAVNIDFNLLLFIY